MIRKYDLTIKALGTSEEIKNKFQKLYDEIADKKISASFTNHSY